MSLRLLLDEMVSPAVAEQLRNLGYDVIAVAADPGLTGQPDEEIIEFAGRDNRCLLTENVRDFEILRRLWLDQGRMPPGLLYASSARFPRSRHHVGALIQVLERRLKDGDLPPPGEVSWLQP